VALKNTEPGRWGRERNKVYGVEIFLDREAERVLRCSSWPGMPGRGISAYINRMIHRWEVCRERMTPAMSQKEWDLILRCIGQPPYADELLNVLPEVVAEVLERRPSYATSRYIDVQAFVRKLRAWTFAERWCVLDALERPRDKAVISNIVHKGHPKERLGKDYDPANEPTVVD